MTTNEMRQAIKDQREARKGLNAKIEELRASGMYSEEYLKKQITKLEEDFQKETQARGQKVAKALEEYKASNYKPVDMGDPCLTNFLTVLNTMGKETPHNLIMESAEHFRGSQGTLDLMAKMIDKVGAEGSGTLKNMMMDTETLNSAIIEASVDFGSVSELGAIGTTAFIMDQIDGANIAPEPTSNTNIPQIF